MDMDNMDDGPKRVMGGVLGAQPAPPSYRPDARGILHGQARPMLEARRRWPDWVGDQVEAACREVATYHAPVGDQAERHRALSVALSDFLFSIVANCSPGPDRDQAINRARESKHWASAAVALEPREEVKA